MAPVPGPNSATVRAASIPDRRAMRRATPRLVGATAPTVRRAWRKALRKAPADDRGAGALGESSDNAPHLFDISARPIVIHDLDDETP